MDIPILQSAALKPIGPIEVCRSFSYKLNVGNYESRDFFCSAKGQAESIEAAESIGEMLDEFVQSEVLKSVGEYSRKLKAQRETNERRMA